MDSLSMDISSVGSPGLPASSHTTEICVQGDLGDSKLTVGASGWLFVLCDKRVRPKGSRDRFQR